MKRYGHSTRNIFIILPIKMVMDSDYSDVDFNKQKRHIMEIYLTQMSILSQWKNVSQYQAHYE